MINHKIFEWWADGYTKPMSLLTNGSSCCLNVTTAVDKTNKRPNINWGINKVLVLCSNTFPKLQPLFVRYPDTKKKVVKKTGEKYLII